MSERNRNVKKNKNRKNSRRISDFEEESRRRKDFKKRKREIKEQEYDEEEYAYDNY